jgi:hypothetical protein
MWAWKKGRQNTGYDVLTLFSFLFIDAHLIYYPAETEIPPHTDKAKGRHYRINFVIRQAQEGGDFVCLNAFINWKRLKFFRPDEHEHSVTKIIKGSRLVFSFGWIL